MIDVYAVFGVLLILIVLGITLLLLILACRGYRLRLRIVDLPKQPTDESSRCDWDYFQMGKRRCKKCDREEWLYTNPYPLLGEPAILWRDMTVRKKK